MSIIGAMWLGICIFILIESLGIIVIIYAEKDREEKRRKKEKQDDENRDT